MIPILFLVTQPWAAQGIDASGTWNLATGDGLATCTGVTITQTGSVVTTSGGTCTVLSQTFSLDASGTIDPTTGVFSFSGTADGLFDMICGTLTISGNVAADSLSLAGGYSCSTGFVSGVISGTRDCGVDSDGDGIGDDCDPCTNVGGGRDMTITPKIVVNKINTDVDPTNDVLTITGEFINGGAFATLNPLATGARVVLKNAVDAFKIDVTLLGGAFGGKGTRGWKLNKKSTQWTFLDKTAAPANGIFKMVILDRSTKAPNRVKVIVKGKKGTYPIVTGDAPINATVVFGGQAAAMAGQCTETDFASADCSFNPKANKLVCKR